MSSQHVKEDRGGGYEQDLKTKYDQGVIGAFALGSAQQFGLTLADAQKLQMKQAQQVQQAQQPRLKKAKKDRKASSSLTSTAAAGGTPSGVRPDSTQVQLPRKPPPPHVIRMLSRRKDKLAVGVEWTGVQSLGDSFREEQILNLEQIKTLKPNELQQAIMALKNSFNAFEQQAKQIQKSLPTTAARCIRLEDCLFDTKLHLLGVMEQLQQEGRSPVLEQRLGDYTYLQVSLPLAIKLRNLCSIASWLSTDSPGSFSNSIRLGMNIQSRLLDLETGLEQQQIHLLRRMVLRTDSALSFMQEQLALHCHTATQWLEKHSEEAKENTSKLLRHASDLLNQKNGSQNDSRKEALLVLIKAHKQILGVPGTGGHSSTAETEPEEVAATPGGAEEKLHELLVRKNDLQARLLALESRKRAHSVAVQVLEHQHHIMRKKDVLPTGPARKDGEFQARRLAEAEVRTSINLERDVRFLETIGHFMKTSHRQTRDLFAGHISVYMTAFKSPQIAFECIENGFKELTSKPQKGYSSALTKSVASLQRSFLDSERKRLMKQYILDVEACQWVSQFCETRCRGSEGVMGSRSAISSLSEIPRDSYRAAFTSLLELLEKKEILHDKEKLTAAGGVSTVCNEARRDRKSLVFWSTDGLPIPEEHTSAWEHRSCLVYLRECHEQLNKFEHILMDASELGQLNLRACNSTERFGDDELFHLAFRGVSFSVPVLRQAAKGQLLSLCDAVDSLLQETCNNCVVLSCILPGAKSRFVEPDSLRAASRLSRSNLHASVASMFKGITLHVKANYPMCQRIALVNLCPAEFSAKDYEEFFGSSNIAEFIPGMEGRLSTVRSQAPVTSEGQSESGSFQDSQSSHSISWEQASREFEPHLIVVLFQTGLAFSGLAARKKGQAHCHTLISKILRLSDEVCGGKCLLWSVVVQKDYLTKVSVPCVRTVLGAALGASNLEDNMLPCELENDDLTASTCHQQLRLSSERVLTSATLADASKNAPCRNVAFTPEHSIAAETMSEDKSVSPFQSGATDSTLVQGQTLRPKDAVFRILKVRSESMSFDEIMQACLDLPFAIEIKAGTDLRSSLIHMLAACSIVPGRGKDKSKPFEKDGLKYRLSNHKLKQLRAQEEAQEVYEDPDELENIKEDPATSRATIDLLDATVDPARSRVLLLDLADRIPYNSVKDAKSRLWDHFRLLTESCKSGGQAAKQLIWFSQQLLPRVLKSAWNLKIVEEDHQSTSPADAWLQKCQACQTFEQVLPLVREYERMAIDWDEVAGAFREEWQAKKNKKKTKKQKGLTPAEEAALAATTQLGHLMGSTSTEKSVPG